MLGRPSRDLERANIVKRIWVAHNIAEDQMIESDRQWYQTRAIVSSMSNKAGKELGRIIQQNQENEESRRRRVIEETVNWVIRGEREDQKPLVVTVNGKTYEVPRIHAASSSKDLQEEMRKIFSDEKDFHDLLVEQHYQKARDRMVEMQRARQKVIEEARQRGDENQIDIPLVGYTPEQLMDLNPELLKQRTTSVMPESTQKTYVYEKYVKPELRVGVLSPKGGGDIPGVTVMEPEEGRLKKQVASNDGESLQEKIEKRSPKL